MMVKHWNCVVVFGLAFFIFAFYSVLGLYERTVTFVNTDVEPAKRKLLSEKQDDLTFNYIYGTIPKPLAKKLGGFNVKLTKFETQVYLEILRTFVELVEKHNLTYWIYSGSLLGSFRHHGFVPWDDDIDVVLAQTEMKKSFEVLNSVKPHYTLIKGQTRWKLYSHKSKKIRPNIRWNFPFLDISFYKVNGDIVSDNDKLYTKFVFNYTDIFPLKKRPFQGFTVSAPKNTEKILSATYDLDLCQGNRFIHKKEHYAKTKPPSVNCKDLMGIFPFVVRTKTPDGINETLQLNGDILSWWLDKG